MASNAKKSWAPTQVKLGVPSAVTKKTFVSRPLIKKSKVSAQNGDTEMSKVHITKGSNVPVP